MDFIVQQVPSIEFLELFTLASAIVTWSHLPEIQNTRVPVYCDNESVKFMVNNLASICEQCQKLIRVLTLNNLAAKRGVFVLHIRSAKNVVADALSRMDFTRFWDNAPVNINRIPDRITPCLWPVDKVWFNPLKLDVNERTGVMTFNFSQAE